MESHSSIENLEHKVARSFDPSVDLKTRIVVAGEIRDVIDTLKDPDAQKVLAVLVPNVVDFLSNTEPSFRKDALEFQFRRVNLDILNRLPFLESVRPHAAPILGCMLHILRHDNEDNATTACKTMMEIVKAWKCLTEQTLADFMSILQLVLQNMRTVIPEVLSESSPLLDPNTSPQSCRSFKMLNEMGLTLAVFAQNHRPLLTPPIYQSTMASMFEFLALESPAQKSARENSEVMGNTWAGVAPTIHNAASYADFISAQVKLLSTAAWIARFIMDTTDTNGETMILVSMRLLQDCPPNPTNIRQELIAVFRHLIATPHRKALLGQLDKLLDDRVLFGPGFSTKERLRTILYSAMADLFHHLKADLSASQITHIFNVYSRSMHDSSLPTSLHTMWAKMMYSLVEPLAAKENPAEAGKILTFLLDASLERLDALSSMHDEINAIERSKQSPQPAMDITFIEKGRPIAEVSYAVDKVEDVIVESRHLFKTLLHGFRVILSALKKINAPPPEGTAIFRLFEGCIRCMALFDFDSRVNELQESIEWFAPILCELNLHVFQEVWTHKIGFFFEQAHKRMYLLNLITFILSKEPVSPTLLAIILKFLIDRLALLGDYDDHRAATTIRLFKMAFHAISVFPALNEPILASPLPKLLMDCFPLAAKASKPTHYFHLLRVLFRSIGGGGGRFELLYNQLLPLLPEMLECLNNQLLLSDGQTRELIVELCLIVPLRLTNLLPHLSYLMQPLALALRGSTEVVAQGLRTLELCIDNLTPHFLDPTLNTVLRELMEALHSHLKPLPANHQISHTAIRILGKLGGRNRRVLTKEPALNYLHHSDLGTLAISFAGGTGNIVVGPISKVARQYLRTGSTQLLPAYAFVEGSVVTMLSEGSHAVNGRNIEELFTHLIEGLFDATLIQELESQAEEFLRKLSASIFQEEIRLARIREPHLKGTSSTLLIAFLNAWPHALARELPQDGIKSKNFISSVVNELVSMKGQSEVSMQDLMPFLLVISNKFIALGLQDSWAEKSATCAGIQIMASTPEIGPAWVVERDMDLVRILLHILRDISAEIPRDSSEIVELLLTILRLTHAALDFSSEATASKNKVVYLAGLFFTDLNSPNPVVRDASQQCISLLVELSKRSAADILMPHRDRMHHALFTKPLRALPFSSQIGKIEATRYCVSLDPPLIELGDELLRLLHETLALADADETALVGRQGSRQNSLEVTKLRVACIKLLTASMPLTDFFSRQHQTRQRVTGVYFKSLYSASQEVKDVAHEGLRMVLLQQSRLPKELLQTGLRPILMNLADPKRLSVPGLEGLARLLELLTNYFKVEIGHKLLDHFRVVADPQLLQNSSRMPLGENEGITKLVCLANIFHLLPSAANTFLDQLVNLIVNTEAQMHFSGQSPFSEPLAKYLDRYAEEGVTHFIENLHLPRHVRTLRSILQARLAPNLQRELESRSSFMITKFRRDSSFVIPTLLLFKDLADVNPQWIHESDDVIDTLVEVWRSENVQTEQTAASINEMMQKNIHLISLFRTALEYAPRIDLLFEIVALYSRNLPLDRLHVTKFLYQHVAMSDDLFFRRSVLMRFLTWFDDTTYSWAQKTSFLRYIVTPMLLVQAHKADASSALVDSGFVDSIQRSIWLRIETDAFSDADDMFRTEVLHFTTVMVQYHAHLVEPVKKHIIKDAWHYITISDDPIVKQTGYLLTARFFAAWPSPQRFILRAWTGLLRTPYEGRSLLRQEAFAALVPSLLSSESNEPGPPQWATTARRLLGEEGLSQAMTIYHLIVKESGLFYPVRSMFVPHIVGSLNKMGLIPSATADSRMLSVDIVQVVFAWDIQASKEFSAPHDGETSSWMTPQNHKETIIGYLIRLATHPTPQDAGKHPVSPRALNLLQAIVGPQGWNDDVAYGLRFFEKALEQTEFTEHTMPQAIATAKTLNIISSEQSDSWYIANAMKLQLLVRKGMVTEDYALQDALHPIVERLLRLYPLPKEDDDQQQGILNDFHSFVHGAIGEGLRNANLSRGALLMLKSVVQVVPERIEPYAQPLIKALSKLSKDHLQAQSTVPAPAPALTEAQTRLLILILDTCQLSMAFLGAEPRRFLLTNIVYLVDKSKSTPLCRYFLTMGRSWAFAKQDPYPTMKEKATILSKMTVFDSKSDVLFQSYLELIYEIYTEPSLRRSDLTSRLEHSFLLGCRAKDPALRERFIDLFDVSVPRSLFSRLIYICGVQSWEALSDSNWIFLALHLLLSVTEVDNPVPSKQVDHPITRFKAQSILKPMQRLLPLDSQAAHETWISVFPIVWSCLSRREQTDLTYHMINLLSKEYHSKQAELRPNVIQTLLGGIVACNPPMILPPHLVKYLAKTFGAWHVSLEILTSSLDHIKEDEAPLRDYVYDSLADVYAEIAEEDAFYGLWRYRCMQGDTNIGLAFEQTGMWEQAFMTYENAQSRSRAGTIPFSESEYCLWEDHWILAAEKLQNWEVLYELARNEGNHELMLESAWRTKDWVETRETLEEQIVQLADAPTPRRRVFEAFLALLKTPAALEKNVDFTKILEDAMQLSLRKWASLPAPMSMAHVPLLQNFQQFVELQEAVQIFGSLSQTTAANLEKKSAELKMVLEAWRERLPNQHDDISIWSDLVAWRQNVFHAINNAYIPLIQNTNGANSNSNTYAYRGYHETAWIINRFAHVARKHDLLDVCFVSLARIYTLPNIEISEAFLKLREQARCYYQKPNELQAGLEVINNTNLIYFSNQQKAAFASLKGQFYARLGKNDDANNSFNQACQLDMTQAKAWAEWGRFNDKLFKENPADYSAANNAVSCYLQAAAQYKNAKSRPLLARVLWLLSLDDASFSIARAFDQYKGDGAFWYWIPFIPQLCTSINNREFKQARYVLHAIARHFPQALFFHMRTTREEIITLKKHASMRAAMQAATNGDTSRRPPQEANTDAPMAVDSSPPNGAQPENQEQRPAPGGVGENVSQRQTWEQMDDVVQAIKTAFPLLILSMETLSDQFLNKFKPALDDDLYRSMNAFIWSDAIQNIILRSMSPDDEGQLSPQTTNNLMRLAMIFSGQPRKDFEADFIVSKPSIYELLERLQKWRDRSEQTVDARPRFQSMDILGHFWTDFQYTKVDDIEVFGQYTEEKDNNQHFVKIQKFYQKFENCKSGGVTWKRITIIGNDHSKTSFSVQTPCHRQCRREEKVMQMFRSFNSALARKKETRKRNLNFHLPPIVALSSSLRLIQTDSSYIALSDIYDLHCARSGFYREEPLLYGADKCRKVLREFRDSSGRQPAKPEYIVGKKIIFDEITAKMVPEDILKNYMIKIMETPSDLWRIRKQVALQLAACNFMTYVVCLSGRTPQRFYLSRTTGQVTMTEVLPGVSSTNPVFLTHDVVPFRHTPNMQAFLGPFFVEGLLTVGIMSIARCLTEPEYDLDFNLCLFSREEVVGWLAMRNPPRQTLPEGVLRQSVSMNIEGIVKRAETLACKIEREQALQGNSANNPVLYTVSNLVSTAANPAQLVKMGDTFYPWF